MPEPQPSPADALMRAWPLLLASALVWACWPTLRSLHGVWAADPRYSHGFLVPLFSAYLLWTRRRRVLESGSGPTPGGLGLLGLGAAMNVVGAAANQDWIEAASLVPSLAGLLVMARGWGALRPAFAPIAFLVFMIPLPYRVELGLGGPLQELATRSSAVILQLLGLPALQEGNTITLGHAKIGVVEACNGLSMLTFFFAISVGLTMVTRHTWLERAMIVAGSIPIALIANVARITGTALLVDGVGHGVAGVDFHDLAGYLMMPLALCLLHAETVLIAHLFREDPAGPTPPVARLRDGREGGGDGPGPAGASRPLPSPSGRLEPAGRGVEPGDPSEIIGGRPEVSLSRRPQKPACEAASPSS
jgi:exosortase